MPLVEPAAVFVPRPYRNQQSQELQARGLDAQPATELEQGMQISAQISVIRG